MFALVGMIFCTTAMSQGENKQKSLFETIYLLPKTGMNKQLEEGVAAHNKKFHAAGKENEAMLRRVEYGNKAGWYVWVMGGNYASLDKRPEDDAHSSDWEENVGKYVEEYGTVDLWSYNDELSYGSDKFRNQKRYESWAVYLKPWQGYRFTEMLKKLKAAFEKMGDRTMLVFNSEVSRKGGPDVAIIWGYDNFADLDRDSNLVDAYEEVHGKGTWTSLLDEWRAIAEDVDMEHRIKIGDM